jgi:acyl carrier protein
MPEPEELLPQVKKLVVERLYLDVPPEGIGDDDDLLAKFGIDSVRLFEIVVGLEETFGISFADEDFAVERFSTARKIAEVVAARAK